SRRRHTRSKRDWSSDVCSSDLIANQPTVKAGGIDIDSAEKVSYFNQLCDAFNVPLVSFVDAPGFLPEEPDAPVIRRTAKLFHTTAAASVGKITVITRKATRSEEHTSELQSRIELVYRL